jgi:membrane fusion protein (multidrug efflux system)
MRLHLAVMLAILPTSALAQGAAPSGVLVTTIAARQGSLPWTLTAYGIVQGAPGSSETLSLLRAGQVARIMVAAGQSVQQGQVLLVVSADPAALTSYRQSVTALALAKGERTRTAQMLAQKLATRDQVALADKAVTDAQGALDLLAQAGGGSAEQTLTAPFDGVVASLPVATGARVAPQSPLVTLDRSSRLVASVGVEPAQRNLVARGQPAQVEPLDGSTPSPGSVLSVGAMLDPVTRLVPVLVDPQAGGSAAGLLPGGPVRVVIQVGEFRGWMTPRDAILTDAKGAYVFQVADGKAARVDVQIAGAVGDTVVATGPIDMARRLVTSGNTQLQDGAAVREDKPMAGAAQ